MNTEVMNSWHKEYLATLYERDKKERANQYVFNNCLYLSQPFREIRLTPYLLDTKLADRIAKLDSITASNTGQAPEVEPTSKPAQNAGVAGLKPPLSGSSEAISRIRQDLSEAQRSKGEMQAQLQQLSEDLRDLKAQSRADSKRINELTTERNALVTRTRDRDEELRGKAKLLMVSFLHGLNGWLAS